MMQGSWWRPASACDDAPWVMERRGVVCRGMVPWCNVVPRQLCSDDALSRWRRDETHCLVRHFTYVFDCMGMVVPKIVPACRS